MAWQLLTPATLPELLPPADLAPAEPPPPAPRTHQQPEPALAAVPAPRALPVSRISYSGLEAYRRCSYRFYLERALRLRGVALAPREHHRRAPGLSALLRGCARARAARGARLRSPRGCPTRPRWRRCCARRAPVSAEDVEDLRAMVAAFVGSRPSHALAAARRVRTELPFAFTLEPPGAGGRRLRGERGGGRVRHRGRRSAGGGLQERRPRGRDPEELSRAPTPPSAWCTRWPPCVPGRRAWRWRTASWSARTTWPSWRTGPTRPPGLEAQLLEVARGVVEAASSPPTRLTASSAGTARTGLALHLGSRAHPGRARRRGLENSPGFPSGAGPIFRLVQHANRRGVQADAPLLHRAAGSDQSRSREHWPRSA